MKKIIQTAGRNALEEFAPQFAHFNDDVLFGENWNNHDIDVKTRSIITVVALMASGITDTSLKFHLQNAKRHGVTQKEIAAIITHVAFYAGWPKGWAVFTLAKEVWNVNEGDLPYEDAAMRAHPSCEERWWTDFNLCCRTRVLSGRRKKCNRNESRRLHQYSGRSKTLAWSSIK